MHNTKRTLLIKYIMLRMLKTLRN